MAKDGTKNGITLTGKDLSKGMANSQYLGIADIRNLDITTTPGIARIALSLTKESGSTVTDLVKYFAINPADGTVYGADESSNIYSRTSGGTWGTIGGYSGGVPKGVWVWKNYLFVAYNSGGITTKIDTYGPLSGVAVWVSPFKTINPAAATTANVPMFTGKNDYLYFGTNQYLASLSENAGFTFAPGTAGTFTFLDGSATNSPLVLGSDKRIRGIAQAGTRIYLACSSFTGTLGTKIGLFPWDLVSTLPDVPIPIGEPAITQIIENNGLIYFQAGYYGSVGITNGSSVQEIKKLTGWNNTPANNLDINTNAIDAFNNGALFGIGKVGSTDNASPVGVYYYRDKAWRYFIPSHGNDGSAGQRATIGAIIAVSSTQYLVSWYDGTNYGVDVLSTSKRYSSYSGYFTTPFYSINDILDKTALARVEWRLTKPLATGEGIRIQYRYDSSASFTTLQTWDFATNGAIQSGFKDFGISTDNVQLKVLLTTGASTTASPEFLSLTLK